MDRLNQLRAEPGGSRDSTLDTSSPPSEAYMTANESSSKYFSLSEVDSTFDISPIKDNISLASANADSDKTITESDRLISNLSPIGKKSDFDTYKIGKQIEAGSILSGGVDIFDDNDNNSYDGDELVIDDNAELEEKSNLELKLADSQFKDENSTEGTLVEPDAVPSKDAEVILQIDGKNVDAIDIGNGLYLYRKEGQEELAAVQIIDDDQQQPSFKFLKVRENNEGNLEVYEEIQIEVPKEVPVKEEKEKVAKNVSHVPIKDITKVMSDAASNKIAERKIQSQNIPKPVTPVVKEPDVELNKEPQSESKLDSNTNKKMKFSESRKSPVIGSFTPMTFHSTPNKEGIPLTKTMVDLQLHPSRHSDNVKKTIEVHTDSVKQRILESPVKQIKDSCDEDKLLPVDKDISSPIETKSPVPLAKESEEEIKPVIIKDIQNDEENIEEEKLVIDETVETTVEEDNNKVITPPNDELSSAEKRSENITLCDSTKELISKDEISNTQNKEMKIPVEPETNKIESKLVNSTDLPESKDSEVVVTDKDLAKIDSDKSIVDKISSHNKVLPEELKVSANQELDKDTIKTSEEKVLSPDLQESKKEIAEALVESATTIPKIDNTKVSNSNSILVAESVNHVSDAKTISKEEIKLPEHNKVLEIETPQEVKPDSSDSCNKLAPRVSTDEIDNSKNVIAPSPSDIVSLCNSKDEPNKEATKDELLVAQSEIETSKVSHLTKTIATDNIEEPQKLGSIQQSFESKQKALEDIIQKKSIPQLTNEVKKTVESPNKSVADSTETTKAIVTVPEPPKNPITPALTESKKHSTEISNKPVADSTEIQKPNVSAPVPPTNPTKVETAPLTNQSKVETSPLTNQSKDEIAVSASSNKPIAASSEPKKPVMSPEEPSKSTTKVEINPVKNIDATSSNKPLKETTITQKPTLTTTEPSKTIPKVNITPEKNINTVSSTKPVAESTKTQAPSLLKTESVKSSTKVEITQEKNIGTESTIKPATQSSETRVPIVTAAEPPKTVTKVELPNTKAKVESSIKKQEVKPNVPQPKNDLGDKKVAPKVTANIDQKPINNNHAPVPFGKWTDVNRQAFLNKIKESKVPTNSSNGKQIKNSNDLNRRDVLKKIDSQRQAQELANMSRLGVKKETAFASKSSVTQESKSPVAQESKSPVPQESKPIVPQESKSTGPKQSKSAVPQDSKSIGPQESKSNVKSEIPILKHNSAAAKKATKLEPVAKPQTTAITVSAVTTKKETQQRKEINNQDLIDKTIEGIINRALPAKNSQDEVCHTVTVTKDTSSGLKGNESPPQLHIEEPTSQTTLDAIEMKMNELHGIPFIERPAHELPHVQKPTAKSYPKSEPPKGHVGKSSKLPNLLPFVTKTQKDVKENIIEVDSEEEVIEHEPITGDMDLIKKDTVKLPILDKTPLLETVTLISADSSKKETIITENDFDKFVRRNSINYENCLTVNFDNNESHNVVQTIVQKDTSMKTYTKIETINSDAKFSLTKNLEQFSQNSLSKPKFGSLIVEDDCNKNYQSKVKMAYQTAMTAKRQLERPITIIEDRPVKVVYMDSNAEYISPQLSVQGQEVSPSKKPSNTLTTTQNTESLDSDTIDSIEEEKTFDETKVKTKHQRKQVLTPVETPELELIAPGDLGIEVSPKKKRRTEEKVEKSPKTVVPKKTYLLGRGNVTDESSSKTFNLTKSVHREPQKQEASVVSHKNTASAIDSLVKAAELLETQSVNITTPDVPPTPDSQQNTPVKRGRGRPRKNPLPEGVLDKTKAPSPQKKPRLIDAKVVKNKHSDDDDDDDDDDSTDDEMIKENWTMGKINENIVCPICNKLFRSENVVFKHVKHCTGPSPSRSDSDNKSPRRLRHSQESDTKSYESKSDDMDIDETITSQKDIRKKRKSKETHTKTLGDKDEVIVIEDTPIKPKVDRRDESKLAESRKTLTKNKVPDKVTSLVCEFCGKTFRQLSYLVNHKLQHGKEDIKKLQHGKDDVKKNEDDSSKTSKSVFSCETCKKEFRKLHHLVQHRLIHNPSSATSKPSRKSSSEQSDHRSTKDQNSVKHTDDPSAGFRCEPCDKSFRKLHHLVEHRETHDGINRQKTSTCPAQTSTDKLPPPPQCDICKKTFRKLHHLIEHKEQHVETSSEKSDDKSIKSSLSTKDIIHECSLCYMVFPNEHSLNKHTIICQRKKRQSASKQQKQIEESEKSEEDKQIIKTEENKLDKDDEVTIVADDSVVEEKPKQEEKLSAPVIPKIQETKPIEEKVPKPPEPIEVKQTKEPKESPKIVEVIEKPESNKAVEKVEPKPKVVEELPNLPIKVRKSEEIEIKPKVQATPRRKTPLKDKVAPTVTKRQKPNVPLPDVVPEAKVAESSDDDEVRYMLNPDYKFEDNEGKLFMKVRANKRNSLQIERPNSKDLVKRRISLQHPPKVPRLKPKPVQSKPAPITVNAAKTVVKAPKLEKLEPVPSTDSDDSDVKYSFPEPTPDDVPKPSKIPPETSTEEPPKKTLRKSMAEKRKSLSSIAKRKSLGKAVGVKHKIKDSPLKQVRKRTADIEHRCDCGQLFSSAALLSRHTTLAHTPPRIRRRRSPPPDLSTKTITKPPRKLSVAPKVKSDSNPLPKTNKPALKRKSSIKTEPKTPNDNRKSPKSSDRTESVKGAASNVKLRRLAAHRGVPVPEKMRKLMEKAKK